jgi:hypothetical protein
MVVVLVEIARAPTSTVAVAVEFRGNRRAANMGQIVLDSLWQALRGQAGWVVMK